MFYMTNSGKYKCVENKKYKKIQIKVLTGYFSSSFNVEK